MFNPANCCISVDGGELLSLSVAFQESLALSAKRMLLCNIKHFNITAQNQAGSDGVSNNISIT